MLKRLLISGVILPLTLLSGICHADERESALKAGFLYNFARYSDGDWFNHNLTSQYTICTTSQAFADIANRVLQAQDVQNVPVFAKYISSPEPDCHSLFVSADTLDTERFIHSPEFSQTMLIGENKGFIQSGGHINFFIAGGRIRFEVDPQHLEDHGIKLSSKVLRMGRIIKAIPHD
jgi:hypothetical protein